MHVRAESYEPDIKRAESESEFETAKRGLADLLNTSYYELMTSLGYKTHSESPGELFVYELLEEKMKAVLEAGPKDQAIEFIKSLLINDRADGSNMPRIFSMEPEEVKKFYGKVEFEEGYVCAGDVFQKLNSAGTRAYTEFDIQTSYQTFYYAAIIEALLSQRRLAEEAIIDCLKETDSLVWLPPEESKSFWAPYKLVKLGKDISKEEFERMQRARPHKSTKDDHSGDWEINDINDDRFIDTYRGGGGQDEEIFSLPLRKIRNGLLSMEVTPETVKYLIERIHTNYSDFKEGFFDFIKIFNKNPSFSCECLLSFIRQEKNPVYRALATRALYHIELGKIEMSEEGVQYLDKTYDLGENNNPNNFAHRATGDGNVAIFDEKRYAVGYFKLHGLDSSDETLKAEMLLFTYETLFHPKSEEGLEERAEREKLLEEFKEKYFQTYLVYFYEETGVHFNNLNFQEQGWFLWYIQNASEEEKVRAKKFIATYREPGFRTFLSLEQDQQNGERILTLGENLKPKTAEAIFAKYGEFVEATDRVRDYLRENFGQSTDFNEATVDKIVENLLRRGKDMLVAFAEKVEKNKTETKPLQHSTFLRQLDEIKIDVLLFLASFKTLKHEGVPVKLEDVRGAEFNILSAEQLRAKPDDVARMRKIYVANYASYPAEFIEKLLAGFDRALNQENTRFYVFKHDGQVVSFNRFDSLEGGELYFGSFNTDPDLQAGRIGQAMLEQSLDIEARRHKIKASCNATAPISTRYIEGGFVAQRYFAYKGVASFEIRRDDTARQKYKYKAKRQEEIIAEYQRKYKDRPVDDTADVIITALPAPQKNNLPSNPMFELIGKEYILTRYFEKEGFVYCVFEKKSRRQTRQKHLVEQEQFAQTA